MIEAGDIFSVVLAVVLGLAVGLEREINGKPAGLRTNTLICLGAAVFTIISENIVTGQPRIAAQIVTGVGFLGAGAIIREKEGLIGLTTAATIWLVASIGMACGAGYYFLAIVSTALALVVLLGLGQVERHLQEYMDKIRARFSGNGKQSDD